MLSARPGKMWKSVRAPEKLGSDASSALQTLEQELLKAHLTLQIHRTLKQRALTQATAGEILGNKQPHVSNLMRGRSGSFSVGRLMEFLTALGQDGKFNRILRVVMESQPTRVR